MLLHHVVDLRKRHPHGALSFISLEEVSCVGITHNNVLLVVEDLCNSCYLLYAFPQRLRIRMSILRHLDTEGLLDSRSRAPLATRTGIYHSVKACAQFLDKPRQ